MKTLTKRIVAFVLMVCMLSAVMAPTALAETVDEETGTITYTYTGASGNANLTTIAYGDITILDKSSGTMKDKETYLQANDFSDTKWIAFSINVKTGGEYAVTVSSCLSVAEVYFFGDTKYDSTVTAESDKYIGSTVASDKTIGHAMTITVTCVAGDNTFLLKGITGTTAHYRFSGLTLTPVEKVVNGKYDTVAEAIDAHETYIQLAGDLTENVTLLNGAKLDLNGHTVTGNVTVANGQIVDNAGNGAVVGTLVATGNEWLPIETAEGTYSFYEVTYKQNGYSQSSVTADSVSFWFDLDMDAEVYDLVKNGGFTIGAKLTWTGNETGVTVDISAKVNDWLEYKDSGENRGLGVQVTGLEGLASGNEVTVTPIFENTETGVSGLFGEAITYQIP